MGEGGREEEACRGGRREQGRDGWVLLFRDGRLGKREKRGGFISFGFLFCHGFLSLSFGFVDRGSGDLFSILHDFEDFFILY
jgi:hypothetical protein